MGTIVIHKNNIIEGRDDIKQKQIVSFKGFIFISYNRTMVMQNFLSK